MLLLLNHKVTHAAEIALNLSNIVVINYATLILAVIVMVVVDVDDTVIRVAAAHHRLDILVVVLVGRCRRRESAVVAGVVSRACAVLHEVAHEVIRLNLHRRVTLYMFFIVDIERGKCGRGQHAGLGKRSRVLEMGWFLDTCLRIFR